MNIDELTPGMYKIRAKPDLMSRSRRLPQPMMILRISEKGSQRKYYVNHDTHGEEPGRTNFNEEFELISKYNTVPQINKPKISLVFKDAAGDPFVFTVSSVDEVRKIFEDMPWLKEPFGYVPNRSRIVRQPK